MHHFTAHELADAWELRAGLTDSPAWGRAAAVAACLRECAAELRHAAAPQPAQADQAAPAPEPEVWLYDFMDGTTAVRNWSTTNKDEAFAPGNFNQRGYVPAEN